MDFRFLTWPKRIFLYLWQHYCFDRNWLLLRLLYNEYSEYHSNRKIPILQYSENSFVLYSIHTETPLPLHHHIAISLTKKSVKNIRSGWSRLVMHLLFISHNYYYCIWLIWVLPEFHFSRKRGSCCTLLLFFAIDISVLTLLRFEY